MKSFVLGCLTLVANTHLFSQEVIGSQGDFSSSIQGSLSWTVGEVITETVTNGNGTLTQGFQQVILSDAAIHDLSSSESLLIFPNPFQTGISILAVDLLGNYNILILDNSGKEIYHSFMYVSAGTQQFNLDLSPLAPGTYHLRLRSDVGSVLKNCIIKY